MFAAHRIGIYCVCGSASHGLRPYTPPCELYTGFLDYSSSLFCFFTPPRVIFRPCCRRQRHSSSRSLLLPLQKYGKLYNTLLFALRLSLSAPLYARERQQQQHAGSKRKKPDGNWAGCATCRFSLVTTLLFRLVVKLKSEKIEAQI